VATARRSPGYPTWGGSAATRLAIALLVVSVATMAFDAYWMLLAPASVFRGAVWQPFTYVFVETSPLGLVFGALTLVSIGSELEKKWGSRLFLRFLVGVTVASGVATTVLGLAFDPVRYAWFSGGDTLVTTTWVAYGWVLARERVYVSGLLVNGDQLAAIGIGLVAIHAAYGSLVLVIPEVIAIGLTYAFVRRR
jgi:membrane associated rhomboid family serine protease